MCLLSGVFLENIIAPAVVYTQSVKYGITLSSDNDDTVYRFSKCISKMEGVVVVFRGGYLLGSIISVLDPSFVQSIVLLCVFILAHLVNEE